MSWDRPALAAAVAALSGAAAFTRPFTATADVVVALAFLGLATTLVAQCRAGGAPAILARRDPPAGAPVTGRRRRWLAWSTCLGGAVAWELAAYLQAPRHAHPTLSSLLDSLDASHAGRGVAFAAWALLGWYLVTR